MTVSAHDTNTMYCLGACTTEQPRPPTPTPTEIPQITPVITKKTPQIIQKTVATPNPCQKTAVVSRHNQGQKGLLRRLLDLLVEFYNLLLRLTGKEPRVAPQPVTPCPASPTNQPTPTSPQGITSVPVTTAPTIAPTKSVVAGSAGCGLPITPGKTTQTITVNGTKRTYILVIPTGLDPNKSVPIIMGFHGGSDTAENASQYMGLTGTEQALYVYPQAPYWAEAGGVAWDVNPAGVDFPYFDAMLSELGKKHCVDTTRVFAAGKSNGAFFVNALACNRPNAIKAIASVAGGGVSSSCTKSMPAMIVHGSADTAVPFAQGVTTRDFWRQLNKCSATTTPVSPSPCVGYSGCSKSVVWCQHSGGHDWPTWAGAGIRKFFLSL